MELRTYKCPHCGANLTIGSGYAKRIFCEYCDSEIILDSGNTVTTDAEEAGYRFEKGRQKAKEESAGYSRSDTYSEVGDSSSYGYSGAYRNDSDGHKYSEENRGAGSYHGNYATYVFASPKSRMVALLLCVFLGVFGAHKFYVGKFGMGLIYFFTIGLFGFGYLIDMVLIALGMFKDRDGLYLKNW